MGDCDCLPECQGLPGHFQAPYTLALQVEDYFQAQQAFAFLHGNEWSEKEELL